LTVINPAQHDTAATRIRARCTTAIVVNTRWMPPVARGDRAIHNAIAVCETAPMRR
jgi:hypothetical protein